MPSLKGHTYFRWWGFSINEGGIPNIHMQWGRGAFYFYVCWAFQRRWWFYRSYAKAS